MEEIASLTRKKALAFNEGLINVRLAPLVAFLPLVQKVTVLSPVSGSGLITNADTAMYFCYTVRGSDLQMRCLKSDSSCKSLVVLPAGS